MKILPFKSPNFNAFLVKKQKGNLIFHDFTELDFDDRNPSTIKLIKESDRKFNFKNFDWVLFNTTDHASHTDYKGLRVISYSSTTSNFENVCPDFIFDAWPNVGIHDYEEVCEKISLNGQNNPETNALGWRGCLTGPLRANLVDLNDGINIDAQFTKWNSKATEDPDYIDIDSPIHKVSSNYVSIPDHSKKWRYLIDMEGYGFSARLSCFMFSRRVVFIADRSHKQWFFPLMEPWKHYIPVNREVDDLKENLNHIKNNPDLEKSIIENAHVFANKHLTRKACLERFNYLLNN